jgi:cation diffusion facilitator CzcD-associated flavoprotein CzcO
MAARSSVFDLGPRARVVFAATWLAAQAALVATAERRPEHAFAFRMFSESTTVVLHLSRRTFDGDLVSCDNGGWWTRSARGARLHLSMRDYIDAPELSFYDVRMPASYGRAAELARLEAALDYVIGRLGDDDRTTAAFVVDVALRSGAGANSRVQVESRARTLDAR